MKCRVYLVRHGETEWNNTMRFQGHTNTELTEMGRNQARALSKRLSNTNFSGIYSSDLDRAYETANIIATPHNIPVNQKAAFREMDFGVWEGLTFEEISAQHTHSAAQWWKDPLKIRVPNGESLGDVVSRSTSELFNICNKHRGQNILVVTHGGVVRSIISSVLGMNLNEYWRLKQNNLALNIVYFSQWDKGILELFNDCGHLEHSKV